MVIKTKHGGKRPNSGPKANDATRKRPMCIRIDPNIFDWLHGKKNIPGGMAGVVERGLLIIMDIENKIH